MKRLAMVLLTVVMIAMWSPALAGDSPQVDEKTIRKVLEANLAAYCRGDLAGVMSTIAPGPEVVFIGTGFDEVLISRQAIESGYRRDLKQYSGIRFAINRLKVDGRDNVAWFAALCVVSLKAGEKTESFPARWTGVLTRTDGKWLLTQAHLSVPSRNPGGSPAFGK